MKIPSKLNILGKTFKVSVQEIGSDQEEVSGLCRPAMQEILINERLPQEAQETTLIHEIIEAINEFMELKLKHPQITSLETGIYQVLKDNKLLR